MATAKFTAKAPWPNGEGHHTCTPTYAAVHAAWRALEAEIGSQSDDTLKVYEVLDRLHNCGHCGRPVHTGKGVAR